MENKKQPFIEPTLLIVILEDKDIIITQSYEPYFPEDDDLED